MDARSLAWALRTWQLSSQPFATGVIYLVYAPDPSPPTGNYEQARENLPQE
jgi:hypothetical protein